MSNTKFNDYANQLLKEAFIFYEHEQSYETTSTRSKINTNVVYFVQCFTLVKIGCSNNITRRFKEIEALNPFAVLLGTVPGDFTRETEIHNIFSEDRVDGEWFWYSEDIEKFVLENITK